MVGRRQADLKRLIPASATRSRAVVFTPDARMAAIMARIS